MSEGNTMRRSFVAVVSRRHIAAAFTVVLVAAAFVAQSSPARTTSVAAGSAATTKVVSKKYGYTLVVAGQWFVHYAVVPWLGGFMLGDAAPDIDNIFDSHDRKFKIAAKPLAVGTTLEGWTAQYADTMQLFLKSASSKAFCQMSRAFRDATIGGEPAREFENACPGYDVIVVTAVHRGRGYAFQFVSPTPNTAASDRRIFDAGRRAFHFTAR